MQLVRLPKDVVDGGVGRGCGMGRGGLCDGRQREGGENEDRTKVHVCCSRGNGDGIVMRGMGLGFGAE